MKTDIKILKIALIATSAIIAPVATMMIQHELQEDEYVFEGDVELASTEETATPISAPETNGTQAPVVAPKPKVKKPGSWRRFSTLQECKKRFKVCIKTPREKSITKP